MASQIIGDSAVQEFIQADIKGNIKTPRCCPLCGEHAAKFPDKRPTMRKRFPPPDIIMNQISLVEQKGNKSNKIYFIRYSHIRLILLLSPYGVHAVRR